MQHLQPNETALLVKFDYEQPIEITDFVMTLAAVNKLYHSYTLEKGQFIEKRDCKLYVEKIEKNSIDVVMVAAACLQQALENANLVFDFAGHLKKSIEHFTLGKGECPKLDIEQMRALKDVFSVSAHNPTAVTSIGAVNVKHIENLYSNCVFNFPESNSSQNQISDIVREMRRSSEEEGLHRGVSMVVEQMRGNQETNTGNKAVIDEIFPSRPLPLLFADPDTKAHVLHSEANPTKRVYVVDVKVEHVGGHVVYKVLRLIDTADL
ncbi:MAG: hypothetical protein NC102_11595 [Clostridium sp.]|nr:hypothetical protein [Clostridium sp.]